MLLFRLFEESSTGKLPGGASQRHSLPGILRLLLICLWLWNDDEVER